MPIVAIAVDDEPMGVANVAAALQAHPGWTLHGTARSGREARALLESGNVDAVFLDIEMPGESGLDVARSLGIMEAPPVIIFVTAYHRFAVEAFELHALDYLLKPFDDERFGRSIARAEELIHLRQRSSFGDALRGYLDDRARGGPLTRFSIRSVGRLETVAVADVRWIAGAGNYVKLHLAGRVVLHRASMQHLERRLDPETFIRTHRGALVRKALLRELVIVGDGTYEARLAAGDRVPVSGRYVGQVRSHLK